MLQLQFPKCNDALELTKVNSLSAGQEVTPPPPQCPMSVYCPTSSLIPGIITIFISNWENELNLIILIHMEGSSWEGCRDVEASVKQLTEPANLFMCYLPQKRSVAYNIIDKWIGNGVLQPVYCVFEVNSGFTQ